ncbi:hypothetical protein SVAN01_11875 [Stagonosporopsis vannaccii]|nr:hypothetical protein SVAN01_11875 [Stagonosporopsis vannaccii]
MLQVTVRLWLQAQSRLVEAAVTMTKSYTGVGTESFHAPLTADNIRSTNHYINLGFKVYVICDLSAATQTSIDVIVTTKSQTTAAVHAAVHAAAQAQSQPLPEDTHEFNLANLVLLGQTVHELSKDHPNFAAEVLLIKQIPSGTQQDTSTPHAPGSRSSARHHLRGAGGEPHQERQHLPNRPAASTSRSNTTRILVTRTVKQTSKRKGKGKAIRANTIREGHEASKNTTRTDRVVDAQEEKEESRMVKEIMINDLQTQRLCGRLALGGDSRPAPQSKTPPRAVRTTMAAIPRFLEWQTADATGGANSVQILPFPGYRRCILCNCATIHRTREEERELPSDAGM